MLNRKIAIRCIADPIHGYGHFSRCLSLATYFSKKNYSILFLINDNKNLKNELTKINLKYFVIPTFKTTSQEGKFLKDFIVRNNISCFILDMKELSEPLSKKIMYSCLTVIIDDSSVNKVYSDIILNGTNIKKY